MAASHWNGTYWQMDEDVHELASRYTSARSATRTLRADLARDAIPSCGAGHDCTEPGVVFATERVGSLRVWREVSGPDNVLFAYVLDGALLIDISAFDLRDIGPDDETAILSGDRILRAAIRRLSLAASPK